MSGYSPILELGDDPLTPREKVAATLDPEVWADDMPVPTRAAVTDFHTRRQASIAKADAVLTALASGSGDHAELARLAEEATARLAGHNLNADGFGLQIWGESLKGGPTHVLDVRGWGYLTGGGHGALGLTEDEGFAAQRAIQAYAVAAWNGAPALLAENAALRAKAGLADVLGEKLERRTFALDEAERKLAEAVGLLRDHDDVTRSYDIEPEPGSVSARSRTFLRKEAERG